MNDLPDLQKLLENVAQKWRIPGASFAISVDGEVRTAVTGVVNINGGSPVSPSTRFRIASITKLFTGILLMQLVEEGLVDLDDPVSQYVPELLLDPSAESSTTLRRLLTHTSGLPGDFFPDTGDGDDALENVIGLAKIEDAIHSPGEIYSYCNFGFIVAGRVIEQVRKCTWDEALHRFVAERIGLKDTFTLFRGQNAESTALSHTFDSSGKPQPSWMWPEWRSASPAGSTLHSSAPNLVAFAQAFMQERTVEASTVDLMLTPGEAGPPHPLFGKGVGLAWHLDDWDGMRVASHSGGSACFLRLVPEKGIAGALLTNAPTGIHLSREVFDYAFGEVLGIKAPPFPTPADPAPDLDVESHAGVYRHVGQDLEIRAEQGKLLVSFKSGADGGTGPELTADPIDENAFVVMSQGMPQAFLAFVGTDGGRPRFLHNGRAFRRVGTNP